MVNTNCHYFCFHVFPSLPPVISSSLIFSFPSLLSSLSFSFFVSSWYLVQDYGQEDKDRSVLKDFWFLKLCISLLIVGLIDGWISWSIHSTGSSLLLPGKKAHLDRVLLALLPHLECPLGYGIHIIPLPGWAQGCLIPFSSLHTTLARFQNELKQDTALLQWSPLLPSPPFSQDMSVMKPYLVTISILLILVHKTSGNSGLSQKFWGLTCAIGILVTSEITTYSRHCLKPFLISGRLWDVYSKLHFMLTSPSFLLCQDKLKRLVECCGVWMHEAFSEVLLLGWKLDSCIRCERAVGEFNSSLEFGEWVVVGVV